MIPPVAALLPLLSGKTGWQAHFADTPAEVRRSYGALLADVLIAIAAAALLMGSAGGDAWDGLLLQALAKLAAVACFLTLFATAALRLGHGRGLCRVIAALNWGLMLISVLIQGVALLGAGIGISALVYGSLILGFVWANGLLFRTIRDGMSLSVGLTVGAILLYWALSLAFSTTALQIQFGGDLPMMPVDTLGAPSTPSGG